MLHACVRKHDMTDTVEKNLGTKRPLSLAGKERNLPATGQYLKVNGPRIPWQDQRPSKPPRQTKQRSPGTHRQQLGWVSLAVSGQPEPQGSRPRHSPCLLRLPPQISPPADMLPSSSGARARGLLLGLALALASLLAPASASESDHKVRARLPHVAPDPSLRPALG